MWDMQQVRTLVYGLLAHRQSERPVSASPAADWLPPVLGPGDWSVGMLADRSAGWYFDRR
jgi:hypothetical protein